MSSKVNVAPVVLCGLALAATATGQRIEPIHSDPSDDKMGKALCAADGVAAIGVTTFAARPLAPEVRPSQRHLEERLRSFEKTC